MDPRLLSLYEQELRYFRESASEFARAFPKIAHRLGIEGQEVADPYVERLIEATAFLSARVRPEARRRIPALHRPPARHRLPALPGADTGDGGRVLRARPRRREPCDRARPCRAAAACARGRPWGRTRTASSARPARCACGPSRCSARSTSPTRPTCRWTRTRSRAPFAAACALRCMRRPGSTSTRSRSTNSCCISAARKTWPGNCTNARWASPSACWCGRCRRPVRCRARRWSLPASAIGAVGFEEDEALLPATATGFSGFRLLQEYFAFPQRFQFVAHRRPEGAAGHDARGRCRDRAAVLARRRGARKARRAPTTCSCTACPPSTCSPSGWTACP